MTTSGIQGQILEITVVGAIRLKDTEWISRQDPYVIVEYASSRFRTRTDTDGGKNPTFNDKFMVPLIEGLREINIQVWNSNVTFDDFIGSGKILLEKVLSTGYDDSGWSITSKSGKYAGEVKTILHFSNVGKGQKNKADASQSHPHAVPPPYPYGAPPAQYPSYAPPQQSYAAYGPPHGPPAGYPPPPNLYAPPAVPYAVPPPVHMPPPAHMPSPYPTPSAYPPPPYPSGSGSGYYGSAPPAGYPPAPYPGGYPGSHGAYQHGKHKHKHYKGKWKKGKK